MRFWIIVATVAIIRTMGQTDSVNMIFLFLFGAFGLVLDLLEFGEKIK